MAYTTILAVKNYLGITGSSDDALIESMINAAQAEIDAYTQRTFEASADTTRYYTVGLDTHGRTLYLDEDLCDITEIITNADSTSPVTLTENVDFIALPRNTKPQNRIVLLVSSDYLWEYTDDPERGVTVTGKFAYSTSAPSDIEHACRRLVGYMYRQKDAQVYDVTTMPDAGVIMTPRGMPADVERILRPYVRRTF